MKIVQRSTGVFRDAIPYHALTLEAVFDIQGQDVEKYETVVKIISLGTDETPEEVEAWGKANDYGVVFGLMKSIMDISGLGAQLPKRSSRASSKAR